MKSNKTLADIPVVVESAKPSNKLHWQRRAVQYSVLILLAVVPLSGLLRIDPIQGAFVIFDQQVWFSDFGMVFGVWVALASVLAMLYSLAGTVVCGWACPQNTLSEWANMMTFKLLGKRAEVSLDGAPMQLSTVKNKALNWVVLIVLSALVSALVALIPLLYFYEPLLIWKFISFQYDAGLAPSLHWIYMIFFLVVFVDVTMIRHFMCRFMCIYKVWQHTFKTKQTLHIAYDEGRSDECSKCNYCATSCFLGIEPRQTDVYDTCINCGECVEACENIQRRKNTGKPSLLRFAMGERQGHNANEFKTNVTDLFARAKWAFPIFILGAVMMIWGALDYERYHISAYRSDTMHGDSILDYRISVANKFYQPTYLYLTIEGLPEGSYTLEKSKVDFETAGRINVSLSISPDLPKGLHAFMVRAKSDDGWEEKFRVHHLSVGPS